MAVVEGADIPEDVAQLLRDDRHWSAARRLRQLLRDDSDPELIVVAAKAEAGWGGWGNVRDLLEGKDWLDRASRGDGWYLLGRAREEQGRWADAAAAYGRYLRARPDAGVEDGERAVAEVRHGLALIRAGQGPVGVGVLEHARGEAPAIDGWVAVLTAEASAERGDTARVRALGEAAGRASPLRAQRALLRAHREARDLAGVRGLALAFRDAAGTVAARTEFGVTAARAALELGDVASARRELVAALGAAPGGSITSGGAAALLSIPGVTPGERLLAASAFERSGDRARAAAGFRAWLASNAGTADERNSVRLRLGRVLFAAGSYGEAEAALRPLASAPPAVASQAMFLIGRAQNRAGQSGAARATLLATADRFRGTPAAADALWLVADLSHDAGATARTRELYGRIVAEHPGSARAGQAMMRLAGMSYAARDYRSAAAVWERYRAAYPRGQLWTQATYWSGRAHHALGDRETAAARWREVRQREPVSYYAVRAADRLDVPYWPLAIPAGAADDPAVAARVQEWMRGPDLLRAAGLTAEAEGEADRLVREAGSDRAVLLALADALNERGFSVQGTRIGRAMVDSGVPWDLRLLRVVYPFPYRAILTAESRSRKLDPALVAALTRQESSFKATISSPVGARGLMQVMPTTGAPLAAAAGIRQWDPDLLFNAEINVHLGTRFLADQMRVYGGKLPYVFSAYNAGPTRVERWRRFPEAMDEELFTERVPFEETRDYVKILTRNIALYRGLYGG
jgi:soluble lytic murein transglycosylase